MKAFLRQWLGLAENTAPRTRSPLPRQSARSFAAAATSRLTADFNTASVSVDTDLVGQLALMRSRSRNLAKRDDYFRRWASLLTKNVIGPNGVGLKVRSVDAYDKAGKPIYDTRANALIEDAWWDSGKVANCSVTRDISRTEMLMLKLRTVATDGECITRKVRGFNNGHGYAEQLIPADCLDETFNVQLGGGRCIRLGVELDEWGAPVAYHLFKRNPSDWLPGSGEQGVRERVPADQISHLFRREFVGQTRGVPWLFSAIMRLNHLNRYEEAEVIAARIGASKVAWIKEAEGTEFNGDSEDDLGQTSLDVEPGTLGKMRHGEELVNWSPDHPNASFESFHRAMMRGVAAAGDVSHHALTGDLSGVNYSSARIGLLDERDGYMCLQNWLCEHDLDDSFATWLEEAMLRGRVPLPFAKFAKFNVPTWRPRRWTWIDPAKEMAAAQMAIALGIKSRQQIIDESDGRSDFGEILSELAEEHAALKKSDLLPAADMLDKANAALALANAEAAGEEPAAPKNLGIKPE